MRSRTTSWLVVASFLSFSRLTEAQPPAMVIDLNAVVDTSLDASPEPIVRFGAKAIFLACEPLDGCEPWVTDGTAPGTFQLVDATAGGSSAFIESIEGRALETPTYAAFMLCTGGGSNDCEPWRSDGTSAGTFRLRDVSAGSSSSNPGYFAFAGGTLYFAADDGVSGVELWKSNGTSAGTLLVEDLRPGANGSDPRHLTALGSIVVFQADNPPSEEGLWRSDGSAPGTFFYSSVDIIGSESVGAADPIGPFAAELAGKVYFSGEATPVEGNQLFATDGTLAGTLLVKDLAGPSGDAAPNGFRKLGSKLLFTAFNPTIGGGTGVELWATDGTGAGTSEISALIPGNNPSNPVAEPTVVGATLFFRNDFDSELWKSDGTVLGTVLVEANGGLLPLGLSAVGAQLCFTGQTAGEGRELWASDGTPGGTAPVVDLRPGSGAGASDATFALSGFCLFAGDDGLSGSELWQSDLSPGDATLVTEIAAVSAPSNPRDLAALADQLYFSADDGVGGRELFTSDATGAGTQRVLDLVPGPVGSDPQELVLLGGHLAFVATDPAAGREVMRSNGTSAGTLVYADVVSGGGGSAPSDLTVFGPDLYFAADDGVGGRGVWRRTPTTLTLVADPVALGIGNARQLTPFLGEIFFLADDGSSNLELWRTNGTAPGTTQVADLTALSGYSEHGEVAVAAGRLMIVLADTANGSAAVWSSDGTGGGTLELIELGLDFDLELPADFVTVGARFLFRAWNAFEGGFDVWTSDGTPMGTVPLDIAAGAALPGTLRLHAGRAWFDGLDDAAATTLWRSDGTLAGTSAVVTSLSPSWERFRVLGSAFSHLFFTPGASEAWTSNGTAVGTLALGAPTGQSAGLESGFVAAGKFLYYAADDTLHGVELWAYRSPSIYSDGFEIGSLVNWSAAVP